MKQRISCIAIIYVLVTSLLIGFSNRLPAQNYEEKRQELVERHLVDPPHGVSINDTRVIEAMKTVPRHRFVPTSVRDQAYRNKPLPIGHGQTISQPFIVGLMTELLDPDTGARILEIGTGSGYQAAVLSEVDASVYSIEIIPELADSARDDLSEAGYDDVTVKQGDGYFGWKEYAPFDGIIVTAAPSSIPPPLMNQLKPGGRLVIPVGPQFRRQQLMTVTKQEDGTFKKRSVMPVRFVPFRRSNGQ